MRFDCQLSTYATRWIRPAISEIVRRACLIPIPALRVSHLLKVIRAPGFRQNSDCQDSDDLAHETRLPKSAVHPRLLSISQSLSLHQAKCERRNSSLETTIPNPKVEAALKHVTPDQAAVNEAVDNHFSDWERNVIKSRFGIGCRTHTLEQLVGICGRTPEGMRQIEKRKFCSLPVVLKDHDAF